MKQIKIAENLVHLRRRKGITQETLADFLGISKASVSKWETGQSLPDVAQLPRLAAYYDITIDELMGYEAQLSMKEIKQAYENFAEAFSCQLFSEVMKEVRDFIRQYYSCYPALLQMVVLLMNHFMLAEPSEQSDILEEMVRLCERIQERCTDVNICTNASVFQANIELLRGNPEIAIEKLQRYQDPWGGIEEAEPALIRAYQVAGRMEEAQEWNQVILYRRLLSLVSNSTYYLMTNLDKKELGFLTIERVKKVMDAYDMSHLHPNTYLGFRYVQAMFYAAWGMETEALEVLESYVREVQEFVNGALYLHGDAYFDRMDAYFQRMEDYFVLPRDQKTVLASLGQELEHPVFARLPEAEMTKIKELCKNFNTLP